MKSRYASAVATTAHARLAATPASSEPSCGGLVNSPFQERNAKLGSVTRTAAGIGSTWDASCMPRPPKAGSSRPIGERPKMTDASSPIAAKARIGASAQSHASSSFPAASAGASWWPSRPVSGRLPTTSPPTMPETASPGTHISEDGEARQCLGDEDPPRRAHRHQQVAPGAEAVLGGEHVTGDDRGEQREEPAARERQHHQRPGPARGVHLAAEEGVRRKRALPADHDDRDRRPDPAREDQQAYPPLGQQLDQLEAVGARHRDTAGRPARRRRSDGRGGHWPDSFACVGVPVAR